ncbi:MAG: hypothetical protein ACTSR2_12005 [Candidatus Hodarchaeales archaeon]
MSFGETSVENIFDIVAQYLFRKPLEEARKEFYLELFAEWSRSNLDLILKAIMSANIKQ